MNEALRLAEWFEGGLGGCELEAAAELRRLHQFAEDQIGRATAAEAALQMTKATHALKIAAVEAQRDALLAVLKDIGEYTGEGPTYTTPWQDIVADLGQMARAAIAAVEEGK